MCVGFYALEHPEYALILCTNRDEFLARPTRAAHFHDFGQIPTRTPTPTPTPTPTSPAGEAPSAGADASAGGKASAPAAAAAGAGAGGAWAAGAVLSGRDAVAGGTWLGINRDGRVALLTNISETRTAEYPSRGSLVSSFLAPPRPAAAAAPSTRPFDDWLASHARAVHAGFNLLLLAPVRAAPAAAPPETSSTVTASKTTTSTSTSTSTTTTTTTTTKATAAATATPATPAATAAPPLAYAALFVSNGGGGGALRARPLTPADRRCGAISNGVDLDDEGGAGAGGSGSADGARKAGGVRTWPKVQHGLQALRDLLDAVSAAASAAAPRDAETQLVERLFDLLSWQSASAPHDRTHARDSIRVDPLDDDGGGDAEDGERHHSKTEGVDPGAVRGLYGTRTSTVLLVRRDGRVLFAERDVWTLDRSGAPVLAGDGRRHDGARERADGGDGGGGAGTHGGERPRSAERSFRFTLPL